MRPEDVGGADSWLSAVAFWSVAPITIPLTFGIGLIAAFWRSLWVNISLCALRSVLDGRKLCSAPVWWTYMISQLFQLMSVLGSRLGLFQNNWKDFGKGQYWFFGEGIWCPSYKLCEEITRSNQWRTSAFACSQAPVPELFASGTLIFLSNDGGNDSEWAAIRRVIHQYFLNMQTAEYKCRMDTLTDRLVEDRANPDEKDFNDIAWVQRTVSKCIFYVMFGIWLDDADAKLLTGWRTLGGVFILPRIAQRMLLGLGVWQVKKLRESTMRLVEKHGLTDIFVQMNNSLPEEYRRQSPAKLCDEIMFVVGFAGIGGTSACLETVGQFLQLKIPMELPKDMIDFGNFHSRDQMKAAFEKNSIGYIKEACRLNPPVTSATRVLKESVTIDLAGRSFSLPIGTLNSYAIGLANRDETVFEHPMLFNPERHDLDKALTWNGVMSSSDEDEKLYPRICPGRFLSQDIALTIVRYVLAGGRDQGNDRT